MRARFALSSLAAALLVVAACGRTNLVGGILEPGVSGAGGAGGEGQGQGGASIASTSASSGPGPGSGGGLAICGDGIQAAGEECDDGNADDSDACLSTCIKAQCGDGIVWAGVEQCDDGNKNNKDACRNDCTLSTCGNGVLDPGEECDDGNASNADACVAGCKAAKCGDKFVWAGVEECDDGNAANTDGCLAGCIAAKCGDGFLWSGVELCDDGNFSNSDACVAGCTPATCGDGFVWVGVEQCDDGNKNQGDGCHNNCKLGACGDGIVDPGEQCDDGNASSSDACVAGCIAAKCGDGFVWAGVEQCDDGNLVNGDGCSSTCKLPICGDGMVDPGEACDLGAGNANKPAFLLIQGALSKAVAPVDRPTAAATFYAYSSASGHTGYEALNGSRMFLYRDLTTGVLSLFFTHGIDFNSSGLSQSPADADFSLTNLPAGTSIALTDDTPSEFFKNSPTTAQGAWKFQNNSDGGVLSGLPIPGNWSIDIKPGFSVVMNNWSYVNADDSLQGLALAQTATLKAFDTPSACRLDCTVPACGDGILDGGEVCDDGNTIGGDGCSADCKALQ